MAAPSIPTDLDDVLLGTGGDDIIDALGGNDRVAGNAGNDTIFGRAGHDTLFGGRGNDTLNGGPGRDTLYGGQGNDTLLGGSGNDTLYGDFGSDTLTGGIHNDTFVLDFATAGLDELGNAAFDTITDFNAMEGDVINLTGFPGGMIYGFGEEMGGDVSIFIDIDSSGTLDEDEMIALVLDTTIGEIISTMQYNGQPLFPVM